LIVPSGALTSLPPHVLITEPPKAPSPASMADYRGVTWLGLRQPVAVLPSVASLVALRRSAQANRAARPYLGVGNPLLDGPQEDSGSASVYRQLAELARTKRCLETSTTQANGAAAGPRKRNFSSLFRGRQADIEQVRQWIALPETADELCDVGRRLGVPPSDILLGADATETNLSRSRDASLTTQLFISRLMAP
jgi:CHAT domain